MFACYAADRTDSGRRSQLIAAREAPCVAVQRAAEVEALAHVAAEVRERVELVLALDPLRDDAHPEQRAELDDHRQQRVIVWGASRAVDERLRHLEDVDR